MWALYLLVNILEVFHSRVEVRSDVDPIHDGAEHKLLGERKLGAPRSGPPDGHGPPKKHPGLDQVMNQPADSSGARSGGASGGAGAVATTHLSGRPGGAAKKNHLAYFSLINLEWVQC